MKIWSNTNTLDGYLGRLDCSSSPEEAEVAVVGGKTFDLQEFPRLRGVFKCGVGTDNIPTEELAARQIALRLPGKATSDVLCDETASYTCYLLLSALYRDVGNFSTWHKRARDCLRSRCLLVVGTGRIGSRVAEKMQAFLRVETFDTAIDEPRVLYELLPKVDCVSIHVPLTHETRGLFSARELALLSDGTAIVNTARGQVVDEVALLAELKSGRLFAALDVFDKEPYRGPLADLPASRVLLSPHVASMSRELLLSMAGDLMEFVAELEARVHSPRDSKFPKMGQKI